MALKWKIIVLMGILAVVALFMTSSSRAPRYPIEKETPVQSNKEAVTEITPPAATGNVDDALAAFLQDSSREALVFQEETGDADLIAVDSQAISDFGQSYDENEF